MTPAAGRAYSARRGAGGARLAVRLVGVDAEAILVQPLYARPVDQHRIAPRHSRASIGGLDIRNDRLKAVEKLGYLPENGPLYEDMTPRDLLKFFGEVRGLKDKKLSKRMDYVIDLCALQDDGPDP